MDIVRLLVVNLCIKHFFFFYLQQVSPKVRWHQTISESTTVSKSPTNKTANTNNKISESDGTSSSTNMSQDSNVQINEETVVEESTTTTEKVPGSNPVVGSGEKSVVLEKQDIETNEKVNLIVIKKGSWACLKKGKFISERMFS